VLIISLLIGKLIIFLTRFLNIGGGSAAPGYYALKIYPGLTKKLVSQIPQNIIITGTNGKTTTSRLVAHFLKTQNIKVIKNSTGSNLERGIASSLIKAASFSGKISAEIGIWEVDEAAFNTVIKKIKPNLIVFLNVFRDQLDRYGEVDSVINKWCDSLKTLNQDALIIVNGDDQNLLKLRSCYKGKIETFGLENYKIKDESLVKVREKGDLDLEAKEIKINGLKGTDFTVSEGLKVSLPLPGIYHIYDFLAAFALGFNLNLEVNKMINSLESYKVAFGRVEKLTINGKKVYIFLIKNPTGASQIFEAVEGEMQPEDTLLFALNDNFADGKDVSWIWDAEFERIQNLELRIKNYASGIRAHDMAVRLKYAGFETENIVLEPNPGKAFNKALKDLEGRLFIFPTYTAMLELQKILARKGHKKKYWEEEG